MRILDLVQHEFEKFSTDIELMERLMVQGKTGMYAWAIRRVCFPEGKRLKGDIEKRLNAVTALIENELKFTRVRYLYYTYPTTPMDLISSMENFEAVRNVLLGRLNNPAFWDGVMPTCWWECIRVAVELLVEQGIRPSTISRRLGISMSLVYGVRKKFLRRIIDKKGIEI